MSPERACTLGYGMPNIDDSDIFNEWGRLLAMSYWSDCAKDE